MSPSSGEWDSASVREQLPEGRELHDYAALGEELRSRFPKVALHEGLGAVSAIGAINDRFASVRRCLGLLAGEGISVRGDRCVHNRMLWVDAVVE